MECNVYPERAPILSLSDGAAFLSISSGSRDAVSARHAEFARKFAEAAGRYAEECARWVERGRVRLLESGATQGGESAGDGAVPDVLERTGSTASGVG